MLVKVIKSDFYKNVLILFSGTLLAQTIPFLVLPFLQKFYYSPSDFGILVVFISFGEIFSNIACLKLEYGIVLQKTMRQAINLLYGALTVSFLMALLSLLIILLFKHKIALFFNEPKIENLLLLIPIYILFVAFYDSLTYWFNRKKRFSIISISKVSQTSAAECSKIALGLIKFNYNGLVVGRVLGYFFGSLYLVIKFMTSDKKYLRLINKSQSKKLIIENKNFIRYTTPSVFIGSVINLLYINLFLHYFGKDIVGVMGVSMIYISASYSLISISFSQVFFSKIAEINSKSELLLIYKKFAFRLFLFSLLPLFFIYLIPTSFVTSLLGEQWDDLIYIARVMSLWLSIWFVSSSLSFIYMRIGKQKLMLLYDLLHLVMIIVGFYFGYYLSPTFESALWGFTIAKFVFYVIIILVAVYLIKNCDESKL